MDTPRRIVVVGAGAVGGVIAVGLHEAGTPVEVVARGRHLDRIRAGGLTRLAPDGSVTVPVASHATVMDAGVTDDDLVIVATKVHQAEAVLDDLFVTAGPDLAVALATNGVEGERLALRRFRAVLGVLVNVPAVHLEPGVVEVHAHVPRGLLDVGVFPSGTSPMAEFLSATLEGAGFVSEATGRIMDRKWAKLLGNVGNVCQVLCGPDTADWTDLYARLRAEAEAVVVAAGVDVDLDMQQHRAGLVARAPIDGRPRPGGSTWQSAARGTGNLETVALNGEISLLGRLHGVPTPANDLVQLEATRMLRDGHPIGSRSEHALLAALPRQALTAPSLEEG